LLSSSLIFHRLSNRVDSIGDDCMFCARLTITISVLTASLAVSAAHAADYSPPPPPPVYIQPQVIEQFASAWYLRGDVGIGINGPYQLDYLPNAANVGNGFAFEHTAIGDTFFIGGGVGYEFNNWLRFDGTVEYRAKTPVSAFGSYPAGPGYGPGTDFYNANLKSWVFLANGYVDLGTWNCFTPFVGAGIGAAYNTLTNFYDFNTNGGGGRGIGQDSNEWHLAWALHAGVAYNVSKNLKVELAYRYLNYGSVTGSIDCVGGCSPDSFKFGNLYSQDIKLGLRWTCCELPPPVYAPPPLLRSKG
jgi:opacity protein-like surface antigen